jgi:hypothetical protein
MKAEGLIHTIGKTRGARWFLGSGPNGEILS